MQRLSYRDILEEEFSYRVKQNPSYSLRAYARDLAINPAQLSEIRKGRIGLSSLKAVEVARRVGLTEKEVPFFQALVELEHGRSQGIKDRALAFIQSHSYGENFESLTIDGFKLISDWHHYGILSCMELDDFDGSVEWVSKKLNISIEIAQDAIKRLFKLDLVDLVNGKFAVTDKQLTSTHNISSSALKKFHKQHLMKSLGAVDHFSVEERDITTMTMAIDKENLAQARELLTKFRREFCRIMESGKKNEVYNLNIQFIPLRDIGE